MMNFLKMKLMNIYNYKEKKLENIQLIIYSEQIMINILNQK